MEADRLCFEQKVLYTELLSIGVLTATDLLQELFPECAPNSSQESQPRVLCHL